jgi:hypothetical protein
MTSVKGETSTKTGIILLVTGFLLVVQALYILDVLHWSPTNKSVPFLSDNSSSLQNSTPILQDAISRMMMKGFIPLAVVPYLGFRIVRYISLELYLSN